MYFAGVIEKKSDLIDHDLEGGKVINLTVGAKFTNQILDMEEEISQRIVMFGDLAEKADRETREGGAIVITECTRNPRIYVTKKGTEVKSVDLVARRFQVITKTKLAEVWDKVKAQMPSLDDLSFKESDMAMALKTAGSGNANPDVDAIAATETELR